MALLSGLLLWLSYSPAKLFPLVYVALAPLMVALPQAKRFRQAFGWGFVAGLVFMGLTCYWIGVTVQGWTGSAIGWAAWAALIPILATYYGLWSGVVWRLSRNLSSGERVMLYAASWVVLEWVRTLGSLSMPWAQLSYSQYLFTPVLQWCDLTGAYGLSFLIVLMNAGVAHWWQHRGQEQSVRWVGVAGLLLVLICLTGKLRTLVPTPTETTLKVTVMQGNFPTKVSRNELVQTLNTVLSKTQEAVSREKTDLLVWSETTLPLHTFPYLYLRMAAIAKEAGTPILSGANLSDSTTQQETNSAILFGTDGSFSHYDKQHLVPFGEFIPFRPYWHPALVQAFGFFESDLSQGDGLHPLTLPTPQKADKSTQLGVLICYEGTYPHIPATLTAQGANLLFSLSNDSWAQSRSQMEQHLATVVLRAVETRRDVVRSTNSGISGIINSRGQVVASVPTDTDTSLTQKVALHEGLTPYVRFGNWFVLFCGVGTLVLVGKGKRKTT